MKNAFTLPLFKRAVSIEKSDAYRAQSDANMAPELEQALKLPYHGA